MACPTDPALPILEAATAALYDLFDAEMACPPKVGGVATVRWFAGDAPPMAAWDSHSSDGRCGTPFVWVRAMQRYRTRSFPNPTVATECADSYPRVMAVELGVAWCAVVDREPRWADYAREADESLDTAWRMEAVLCKAARSLRNDGIGRQVGTDTVTPYGPEGGVIAWLGTLYATY